MRGGPVGFYYSVRFIQLMPLLFVKLLSLLLQVNGRLSLCDALSNPDSLLDQKELHR